MNINRHNYEAFFLDHLEERLSPEQEIELMEFLSLNPDLAAELTDYESVYLNREEIIFEGKSGIKKNEGELTPMEQLIALMEGDLTSGETAELKKKIQTDKYLLAQSEMLQKTKLVPDASIHFPYKNKLKRKGKVVYMWRYAAAAAIVIIGLTVVFRNIPDKIQNETVAQKNAPAPSVVSPHDKVISEKKVLADNKKPVLQLQLKKKLIVKEVSKQPVQIISTSPITPAEISKSAQDVELAVEPVLAVEAVQPVASTENTFNYREIFTEAEWRELQNMSEAEKFSWTQQFARRSINRIGELTGVHVQLPSREKQQDVFAFSVGNFEVRHVSVK